jgi:shikimate kinase
VTNLFVLVGMPASGKSTIARAVSERLGCNWIDTDALLQEQQGCTVAQVFAQQGEQAFRRHESDALAQALQATHAVVSTGGGIVLSPANRGLLKSNGRVTYLFAEPLALFSRVKQDGKRPLLQTSDPLATLNNLYDIRHPLYLEASHCVFQTQLQPLKRTVEGLLSQWRSLGWLG